MGEGCVGLDEKCIEMEAGLAGVEKTFLGIQGICLKL